MAPSLLTSAENVRFLESRRFEMSGDSRKMSQRTLAVHAGERQPGPEGSVVYPIYQGTVYTVPPGTD
jgi:hypothetical protein